MHPLKFQHALACVFGTFILADGKTWVFHVSLMGVCINPLIGIMNGELATQYLIPTDSRLKKEAPHRGALYISRLNGTRKLHSISSAAFYPVGSNKLRE